MLALKYILLLVAVSSIAVTLIMAGYDLWLVVQFRRNLARTLEGAPRRLGSNQEGSNHAPIRWRFFSE